MLSYMRKASYATVLWKEKDKYISQCLDVDISSFGKTKKEALDKLEEALALYFEDSRIKRPRHILRPEITHVTVRHVA